jgi:hypothetical protein
VEEAAAATAAADAAAEWGVATTAAAAAEGEGEEAVIAVEAEAEAAEAAAAAEEVDRRMGGGGVEGGRNESGGGRRGVIPALRTDDTAPPPLPLPLPAADEAEGLTSLPAAAAGAVCVAALTLWCGGLPSPRPVLAVAPDPALPKCNGCGKLPPAVCSPCPLPSALGGVDGTEAERKRAAAADTDADADADGGEDGVSLGECGGGAANKAGRALAALRGAVLPPL